MRLFLLWLCAAVAPLALQAEEPMNMREHMNDDPLTVLMRADRLEWQDAKQDALFAWDASVRIGRDFNRLLLRSEGKSADGRSQEAELEALWERPISRWWELLVGARHDFGAGQSQSWLAVGASGLLPWRIHLQASGYVGEGGRTALRLESDYDVRFTNRLILQPRVEFNAYGNDARDADVELGLRLRFEIRREIAPYLGTVWVNGAGADELRVLAGLRAWY
ncbi:MAG: copper resistance protein B [Pseudomonadota bacterium]